MKKLILLMMLAHSTAALGNTTYRVEDPKRVVKIVGAINSSATTYAEQISRLSRESKKPIDILVNSPGGSVFFGMIVVDAIHQAQARGVKVNCSTGVLAASMGFIILAECNNRYALPNARLLFHPISISVRSARVNELVPDLVQTLYEESAIKRRLQGQLGMKKSFFEMHYDAETFWQASRLKKKSRGFLKVVRNIEGFEEDLFRYYKPSLLGMFGKVSPRVRRIIERFYNLK